MKKSNKLVLMERGSKTVNPPYYRSLVQSKVVNYEVYFSISYFESYLNNLQRSIERSINRSAFSVQHKSTAGAVLVLANGNKKVQPSLKPLGKPNIHLTTSIPEVSDLILEHFKQSYDISAGEHYSDGDLSIKAYEVDTSATIDYSAVTKWKLHGEGEYILKDILNLMALEGVLSPATYLITK